MNDHQKLIYVTSIMIIFPQGSRQYCFRLGYNCYMWHKYFFLSWHNYFFIMAQVWSATLKHNLPKNYQKSALNFVIISCFRPMTPVLGCISQLKTIYLTIILRWPNPCKIHSFIFRKSLFLIEYFPPAL